MLDVLGVADGFSLREDLCVKLGGGDDVGRKKGVVKGEGPYVEMVHADDVRDGTDVAAELLHVYRFGRGVHENLEDPAGDGKGGKESDDSKEEGCGWVGDVVERAVLCGSPVGKVVSSPDGTCGGHDADRLCAVADGVDKSSTNVDVGRVAVSVVSGPGRLVSVSRVVCVCGGRGCASVAVRVASAVRVSVGGVPPCEDESVDDVDDEACGPDDGHDDRVDGIAFFLHVLDEADDSLVGEDGHQDPDGDHRSQRAQDLCTLVPKRHRVCRFLLGHVHGKQRQTHCSHVCQEVCSVRHNSQRPSNVSVARDLLVCVEVEGGLVGGCGWRV